MNFDWEQFETLLKRHDWFYGYSDDHRYYSAGRAQWEKIMSLMPAAVSTDYNRVVELYNKYSPDKVESEWFNFFLKED